MQYVIKYWGVKPFRACNQ